MAECFNICLKKDRREIKMKEIIFATTNQNKVREVGMMCNNPDLFDYIENQFNIQS